MGPALSTILSFISVLGNDTDYVKNTRRTIKYKGAGQSVPSESPDCFSRPAEDATLLFPELTQKYGYPAEEHMVTTEDGYKLKIFHIPGKNQQIPILLYHGVTDSSDTWVVRGETSLGITLARQGYDVWFGNVRGNRYSKGHVDPEVERSPARYYNYTFNEHGQYDLATSIDLVLDKTGAKKVNTIGHSQGNLINFVLCSTRPEYNEKINVIIALAPVAFLANNPPPVSTVYRNVKTLYKIFKALKYEALFEEDSAFNKALRSVCQQPLIGYAVCALSLTFPFTGFDIEEFGPCFLRVEVGHLPTPTSVKNAYHIGQIGYYNRLAQFDYEEAGNQIAYGSTIPPEYDLSKVTTKVALLAGMNDNLATVKDVEHLKSKLPNVVYYKVMPRTEFNHLDFTVGRNMPKHLFPFIFEVLQTYGNI